MLSTLRRRLLRPWTVLPLVVVVGGGTWFVSRSDADDGGTNTTIERTVEASSGPIEQVVSASGTVEAADTEQLGFTAAGTVTAVNVAAGDEVAVGDVLATLDSPELEAAVTQAEADVADAEARLDSDEDADASETQLAADRSTVDAAQRQLDAAEEALGGTKLVASVAGTVTQVDLAVGDELAGGGTSGTDLTGSGTGSGQTSSNLGSGGTGAGPADAGAGAGGTGDTGADDSTTSTTQVEVVSTGSYRVELGIDATEVDLVAQDQEATVRPSSSTSGGLPGGGGFPGSGGFPGGGDAGTAQDDAGDQADSGDAGATTEAASDTEATGTVTSVGAIADASSGVASFPVTVTFESTSAELTVGSTVDVEIVYERIDDAIQVPAQAVTSDGAASTVVVRTDGGDETRTIETGVTSGGMVQVTSGLEAGEQVVITLATGVPAGGGDDGDGGGGPGGGGGFTPPPGFTPGGGGGFPGGQGGGG